MTEQEAIVDLKGENKILSQYAESEFQKEIFAKKIERNNIAIKALEKQIPKKPNFEGDGYSNGQLVYDTWICPYCEKKYEIEYEEYICCPNCGQRIDWSE